MMLKNAIQWDERKSIEQRPKIVQNKRKRFAVKFCIELCVSLANLRMGRFMFLYAPVLTFNFYIYEDYYQLKLRRL